MGVKKVVIVGGVAGGMSAAARLRRRDEQAEIVILERTGYVSFANCGLPYYLGREIPRYDDLVLQTPQSLASRFRLDVRVHHEVRSINVDDKRVGGLDLSTGKPFSFDYDELILSVGAQPIKPPVPGLDRAGVFTLRNLEDTAAIEDWIMTRKPQAAAVVGGGYIGIEMAEQLHRRGLTVHVIDGAPQVLPPFDREMAELIHDELRSRGVELHLGAFLEGIEDGPGQVGQVRAGGAAIEADLVLLGLGVKPDTVLARAAGLAVGDRGGIKVDEHLRTSEPHIWAVGDAIEVVHPISGQEVVIALGGPANRQGRMVADNICGDEVAYGGTLGTAILRVFDLQAGATGLKESQLKELGKPFEAIYLHPKHHAGYYPGAQPIALKLLFHPGSGEIYGAQAIGKAGVDKRIDVIATAILGGLTVRRLAELELAYSPPFGSAKDPINLAGMMACNIMDGLLEQAQWHELAGFEGTLVDVRSQGEVEKGAIEGSLHIPLPELRDRLEEIPKDQPVIAYCQSGQRSYFASRILAQHGYQVRNLSGAYLTYRQGQP